MNLADQYAALRQRELNARRQFWQAMKELVTALREYEIARNAVQETEALLPRTTSNESNLNG